jgi:peroxiredoxin
MALLATQITQASICQAAAPTTSSGEKDINSQNTNTSLKEQLDDLAGRSRARMPAATATVVQSALDEIQKSGVTDRALKVGQRAPDFALPDAKNKMVSLSEVLAKGPAVISFYRGGWCPYCNLSLHALQEALSQIESTGATLIAISPQVPDQSLSTAEKDSLAFPVLSDAENKIAKKFGIVYQLPADLAKLTKGFGVDLAKYNGDQSNELPLAATYILKQDRTVVYAFVDVDYKKRMEPSDIVNVLKGISPDHKKTTKPE